MTKKKMSISKKNVLFGWIFVSPFVAGFLLFMALPLFSSLRISFSKLTNTVGISEMNFIGFGNYIKAFVGEVSFLSTFTGTVVETLVYTPLVVIFSLIIAIMINKKIKFKGLFRCIFFLPFMLGTGYILSMLVELGVTGKSMALGDSVMISTNQISSMIGPELTGLVMNFMSAISLILWKSGVQILLFLSGLQGISRSLYESAKCDSANEWEMFWKITLPMISPLVLLTIVYTIIDYFTDINNSVVKYFTYYAFTGSMYEYASAVSWIYFAFIAILLALVFLFMRRAVFYSSEK